MPLSINCKIGPMGPRFDAYPTSGYTSKPNQGLTRDHTKRSYSGSTLIPDICKNYDPIKSEPKGISCSQGRLYHCNNFESHEGMKDGCLFCCNWVSHDGEDKGYKSTPEKMITYYTSLYKEDSDKFVRFFRKRDFKEKKKILEGILECDFTNETIIKYFDENWSNLVREVGLSLV
ncbi:MAG: hypothetical protein Q8O03_08320 [Nanoarchaeota archaeon]|nr:hypothetical protein [Nanoarchaeota archaeon]